MENHCPIQRKATTESLGTKTKAKPQIDPLTEELPLKQRYFKLTINENNDQDKEKRNLKRKKHSNRRCPLPSKGIRQSFTRNRKNREINPLE